MTAAPSLNPDRAGATIAGQPDLQLLASRILMALANGRGLAVVTGEPPPELTRLAQAIGLASAGRHLIIAAACGPEFSGEGLLRIAHNAATQHGRGTGEAAAGAMRPLLFVLQHAERLTVPQIEELYEVTTLGRGIVAAAVLVGAGSFAARLASPGLRFLREGARGCFDSAGTPLTQLALDEPSPIAAAQAIGDGASGKTQDEGSRTDVVPAAESSFPDRPALPLLLQDRAAPKDAPTPEGPPARRSLTWLKTGAFAVASASIVVCLVWLVPSLPATLGAHLARGVAAVVAVVDRGPSQDRAPVPTAPPLPISVLSADAPLSGGALAADARSAEGGKPSQQGSRVP